MTITAAEKAITQECVMFRTRKQRELLLWAMIWTPAVGMWTWVVWDSAGVRGVVTLYLVAAVGYGLWRLSLLAIEWTHRGEDE